VGFNHLLYDVFDDDEYISVQINVTFGQSLLNLYHMSLLYSLLQPVGCRYH